jgi:hypothetical protein
MQTPPEKIESAINAQSGHYECEHEREDAFDKP